MITIAVFGLQLGVHGLHFVDCKKKATSTKGSDFVKIKCVYILCCMEALTIAPFEITVPFTVPSWYGAVWNYIEIYVA